MKRLLFIILSLTSITGFSQSADISINSKKQGSGSVKLNDQTFSNNDKNPIQLTELSLADLQNINSWEEKSMKEIQEKAKQFRADWLRGILHAHGVNEAKIDIDSTTLKGDKLIYKIKH